MVPLLCHYHLLSPLPPGVWPGCCTRGCVRGGGGTAGGRCAAGLQCHRVRLCALPQWGLRLAALGAAMPDQQFLKASTGVASLGRCCGAPSLVPTRLLNNLLPTPLPNPLLLKTARLAAARRTLWRGGSRQQRGAASSRAPLSTYFERSKRVGTGSWVLGAAGGCWRGSTSRSTRWDMAWHRRPLCQPVPSSPPRPLPWPRLRLRLPTSCRGWRP